MQIHPEDRRRLIDAALGKIPCDLAIRNVRLFNVLTWETYEAEVGIIDGFVACVAADPDRTGDTFAIDAKEEYDGGGRFLVPGFIDSHLHIESSMLTPYNMASAVLPCGTTTLITDPHEVANVGGVEAVEYMLDASENLPMRQYVLVPSCVPAVPELENAGASFGREEVEKLLDRDRVLGLAELMDYSGILSGSVRMREILDACERRDGFMQGHAPYLAGRNLNAYIAAGPRSDHETRTAREARDKLRLGMVVDARESSMSLNIGTIVPAVADFKNLSHLTLCTDDREPEDILRDGHMNHAVARAVECGLTPEQAITCATLNAAREVGITNLGAIAPGYVADMQIVENLSIPKPVAVFSSGRLVAENGKMVVSISAKDFPQERKNTVLLDMPVLEDLKIPASGSEICVRVVDYKRRDSSGTSFSIETLPVLDGCLSLGGDEDLKFAAVFNRHGKGTKFVGVVRGFGSKRGAYGATVSHDSHNMVAVYEHPADALLVMRELMSCGGGKCCALDGEVLGKIELPIYGLISKLSAAELAVEIFKMKGILRERLGLDVLNPVMRIVSLALPVIPEAKFSDIGLVDVLNQKIVPLGARP